MKAKQTSSTGLLNAESKQSNSKKAKNSNIKAKARSGQGSKRESGEEIESVNLVNAKSQALVEGLIELEAAKVYLDHVRILIFPTCRNCLKLSPFLID